MNTQIRLIEINKLRKHEMTCFEKVALVKEDMLQKGYIQHPIIVDRTHNIILDGHHRVEALIQLGADKIPAYMVDYQDKSIQVSLRRKNYHFKDVKKAVIDYCNKGKIFPSKTTKHLIKNRPRNINVKISYFINNCYNKKYERQ